MIKGFKLLEFKEIQPQIEHLHEFGWDSGLYVGFPCFKDTYNMMAGGVTDWTGYPSMGKTEMALELLFNMSSFYGWVHILYVPDIGKSIEVMAKLIHKHTGKTFIKRYHNYIDLSNAFESCGWLMEHFKIIHKTDPKAQVTPIQLWEGAVEYQKEHRVDSVLIDSWKDLFHDYQAYGNNYAQYLSHVLPIRNEIAEKHKIHMHTVIHPKNATIPKDLKIRPVTYHDMEGGAQWSNSGKCILAIHREDFDTDISDIYARKIKPESVGKMRATPLTLKYDIIRSRYFYQSEDGAKIYAQKEYCNPKEVKVSYEY